MTYIVGCSIRTGSVLVIAGLGRGSGSGQGSERSDFKLADAVLNEPEYLVFQRYTIRIVTKTETTAATTVIVITHTGIR